MIEKTDQPTHLPAEPAQIDLRGYHLALVFHPQIRLDRKRGFELAAALSDYIEPSNAEVESQEWKFSQPLMGSPKSRLNIVVAQKQIQIEAVFPAHAKEWLEQRFASVLQEFRKIANPELILSSAAMIRAVLQIDGDAREFLARHVMNLAPERTSSFGRPIHLVGLRFFLPPFEVRQEKGKPSRTEWQIDVKAESLIEDPSKLFLEADGRWPASLAWTDQNQEATVERLRVVSDYLQHNVVAFLRGK